MISALKAFPSIPVETLRAARMVYNPQHVYLRIGDHLESLYAISKAGLIDPLGHFEPELALRLALASAFQYAESLTDPSASEASMRRLDWKYALALPANHPGLAASALCAFRQALYASPSSLEAYAAVLRRLATVTAQEPPWLPSPDPAEILVANCLVTHLDLLEQAMRQTLSALSSCAPEWMRAWALPHWYERYKSGGASTASAHLSLSQQRAAALALGTDIRQLLSALEQPGSPETAQAETRRLAHLWAQHFQVDGKGIHWHSPDCVIGGCNDFRDSDP